MIGNKIADKITSASKKKSMKELPNNNNDNNNNNNNNDNNNNEEVEITAHKKIYLSATIYWWIKVST